MDRVLLTKKGAEELQAELKNLKSVERPKVIEAIAEARAHGDLSENAEYHAAREQQSFIDYINSYRVEAFKQRIKNKELNNYTMVAIAENCGFKSSSAFYAAFKKLTGVTPKQYKDQFTPNK